MDLFQYQCFLHCRVPRIHSSSGVKTIAVPWADDSHRFTLLFETWAIDLLLASRNQTPTAQLLRCGFQTIHGILKRTVARGMALGSDALPLHMSLDEKAIKKGPSDATILSDSTQGMVFDLVEGRTITNVQDLLRRPLPKENTSKPSPPIGGGLLSLRPKNGSLRSS